MRNLIEQGQNPNVSKELAKGFRERFASVPRVFRAPGRVNLIGEHTDYNDGFVLPAAIDLYMWAAVALRNDQKLVVFSENLREQSEIDLLAASPRPRGHWSDYVYGVALMLQKSGVPLRGADVMLFSNVPIGAGLSSSAALEVSVASGLLASLGIRWTCRASPSSANARKTSLSEPALESWTSSRPVSVAPARPFYWTAVRSNSSGYHFQLPRQWSFAILW